MPVSGLLYLLESRLEKLWRKLSACSVEPRRDARTQQLRQPRKEGKPLRALIRSSEQEQ